MTNKAIIMTNKPKINTVQNTKKDKQRRKIIARKQNNKNE